jgi:hypothetical protein
MSTYMPTFKSFPRLLNNAYTDNIQRWVSPALKKEFWTPAKIISAVVLGTLSAYATYRFCGFVGNSLIGRAQKIALPENGVPPVVHHDAPVVKQLLTNSTLGNGSSLVAPSVPEISPSLVAPSVSGISPFLDAPKAPEVGLSGDVTNFPEFVNLQNVSKLDSGTGSLNLTSVLNSGGNSSLANDTSVEPLEKFVKFVTPYIAKAKIISSSAIACLSFVGFMLFRSYAGGGGHNVQKIGDRWYLDGVVTTAKVLKSMHLYPH